MPTPGPHHTLYLPAADAHYQRQSADRAPQCVPRAFHCSDGGWGLGVTPPGARIVGFADTERGRVPPELRPKRTAKPHAEQSVKNTSGILVHS